MSTSADVSTMAGGQLKVINFKFTGKIAVNLVQKMGGDWMVVAAAKVSTSGTEAMEFATENRDCDTIPEGCIRREQC